MPSTGSILVTGATGFIGSHTCVALADAGYAVHGIDNFSNSSRGVVDTLAKMCGPAFRFDECDVRNSPRLSELMKHRRPDAVIHFAALKSVPESVSEPLRYYDNNVAGSLSLFTAMKEHGVRNAVFSSSATVYGDGTPPYSEESPTGPVNPYGSTKLIVEGMLRDLAASDASWKVTLLRYFNPVGAHPGGLIGEELETGSSNLMPALLRVAIGQRDHLTVFGDDYPTPDGTALRDYIHVMDLAEAHVAALKRPGDRGVDTINLGTGRPISVLEMLTAFRNASGREVPVRHAARRDGDVPSSFARVDRAREVLGWTARRSLDDMCRDAWRFAQRRYLSG
jgi:UDP-glucose 4-epimerase